MLTLDKLFVLHNSLHAHAVVKNSLSDTKAFGSYLQKLVIGEKFHALLKAHESRGNKAESLVASRGTSVGKLFLNLSEIYCRNSMILFL